MYRIGDYDTNEKYFNQYLEMDINEYETVLCYASLSKIIQILLVHFSAWGHCYVALKQYEQGEKLMQEALQIRRKSLPGNHHDFALTYSSLGLLYKIIMKNELALEYFLKAREIHLASGEPDLLDLLITERGIRMLQASDYRVSSPSLK
ncbi:unnamed protein product [Rotaria sp. Silwood1]|nr:unnamed protein product [Rotaria sp. Silwood1]